MSQQYSPPSEGSEQPAYPEQQYPAAHYPGPAQTHQGYGQYVPVQPVFVAAEPKGLSITALILGIIGVISFGFFFIPQVLAVIFGHIGLHREPAGRGMAIAGLIMGYIVIGLWAASIGFYFIFGFGMIALVPQR